MQMTKSPLGVRTVALPAGYVDHRDRGALAARLHEHDESLQVDYVIGSTAYVTAGPLSPEPAAATWQLTADGARPAAAAALAERARQQGQVLARLNGPARVAVVARIAPAVERLRDAIARHIGCGDSPWDLSLTARWSVVTPGEAAIITEIQIHRTPGVILDRVKRVKLWRDIATTVLPPLPGTSWRVADRPDLGEVTLYREGDPLAYGFDLADFAARYREVEPDPATAWKAFPIAIREDGSAVQYALFHTLCVGQTGAGKGSVLWSVISGLIPSARAGLVEFYAIDPKNSEAKTARGLFEEVAVLPEQWDDLLERLVDDLKARQANSGRSFQISQETPLRILFVDEMSALSALDSDAQRKARVQQNLLIILSQGRSDGNIVIAAVQAPQKEMVGQARMFFALRVALRTETAAETDIVLGAGATEEGAAAHLIPPASEGNGYASAGTGYTRVEGEASPARVRFPRVVDSVLEAWSTEFAALRRERKRARGEAEAKQDLQLDELELSLDDLEVDPISRAMSALDED